jgi:hypothetical protein
MRLPHAHIWSEDSRSDDQKICSLSHMETLPSGGGHTPFRIYKFIAILRQSHGHVLEVVFVMRDVGDDASVDEQ